MPTQNAIDLVHLEKYVAGDAALRDEILTMFAERAHELNEALKLRQSDHDRKVTLHTLKGGARGVGAWALGDLCEKAEQINTVPEKAAEQKALIGEIDKAVADVVAAVQTLHNAA